MHRQAERAIEKALAARAAEKAAEKTVPPPAASSRTQKGPGRGEGGRLGEN